MVRGSVFAFGITQSTSDTCHLLPWVSFDSARAFRTPCQFTAFFQSHLRELQCSTVGKGERGKQWEQGPVTPASKAGHAPAMPHPRARPPHGRSPFQHLQQQPAIGSPWWKAWNHGHSFSVENRKSNTPAVEREEKSGLIKKKEVGMNTNVSKHDLHYFWSQPTARHHPWGDKKSGGFVVAALGVRMPALTPLLTAVCEVKRVSCHSVCKIKTAMLRCHWGESRTAMFSLVCELLEGERWSRDLPLRAAAWGPGNACNVSAVLPRASPLLAMGTCGAAGGACCSGACRGGACRGGQGSAFASPTVRPPRDTRASLAQVGRCFPGVTSLQVSRSLCCLPCLVVRRLS